MLAQIRSCVFPPPHWHNLPLRHGMGLSLVELKRPCLLRILQVTVELKNDLAISGTLHSVDQYLNIKLNNVHVINETKYPHMVRVYCCLQFHSCHVQTPEHAWLPVLVTCTNFRGTQSNLYSKLAVCPHLQR